MIALTGGLDWLDDTRLQVTLFIFAIISWPLSLLSVFVLLLWPAPTRLSVPRTLLVSMAPGVLICAWEILAHVARDHPLETLVGPAYATNRLIFLFGTPVAIAIVFLAMRAFWSRRWPCM